MKVLIQGNCALQAQVALVKRMFPDWDVRGVLIPQANAWIAEGHAGFADFVDSLDLFLGLTVHGDLKDRVPLSVRRVLIPAFSFFGYHPDTMLVIGLPSPLEQGNTHSRIAAAAYLAGRARSEVRGLFSGTRFEALDYFDRFALEKERAEARYRDEAGVALGPMLAEWAAEGVFMYCPPHARAKVFMDVAHAVMLARGLSPAVPDTERIALRADFQDYMATGILWPVYPEVAEALGVSPEYRDFRLASRKNDGAWLDLDAFIDRSYAVYDTLTPDQRGKLLTAVGGAEGVARTLDA